MVTEDIRDEILRLYRDKTFSGSYSGLEVLRNALEYDKQIKISIPELRKVMKNESMYLIHLQNRKRFPRRSYEGAATGFGSIFQAGESFSIAERKECNYSSTTFSRSR